MVKNPPANSGDTSSILGSGRSHAGGNVNLLQYSCLGNPMDRVPWRATVHGVTKSPTRLTNWADMQGDKVAHIRRTSHSQKGFKGSTFKSQLGGGGHLGNHAQFSDSLMRKQQGGVTGVNFLSPQAPGSLGLCPHDHQVINIFYLVGGFCFCKATQKMCIKCNIIIQVLQRGAKAEYVGGRGGTIGSCSVTLLLLFYCFTVLIIL